MVYLVSKISMGLRGSEAIVCLKNLKVITCVNSINSIFPINPTLDTAADRFFLWLGINS